MVVRIIVNYDCIDNKRKNIVKSGQKYFLVTFYEPILWRGF